MELTSNAKSAIAYSLILAALLLYDMAMGAAHPAWGATRPDIVKDMGPLIGGVFVPLYLLLIGVAVALVWQERRSGFILAIVLVAFVILGQIPLVLARLSADFPYAAGICVFGIIIGALVVWYAWQGRRELVAT